MISETEGGIHSFSYWGGWFGLSRYVCINSTFVNIGHQISKSDGKNTFTDFLEWIVLCEKLSMDTLIEEGPTYSWRNKGLNTGTCQDYWHYLSFLVHRDSTAWKKQTTLQQNSPTKIESVRFKSWKWKVVSFYVETWVPKNPYYENSRSFHPGNKINL